MQEIIEMAQSGASMEALEDAIYEFAYIRACESDGPNSCDFNYLVDLFERNAWKAVEEIQGIRD